MHFSMYFSVWNEKEKINLYRYLFFWHQGWGFSCLYLLSEFCFVTTLIPRDSNYIWTCTGVAVFFALSSQYKTVNTEEEILFQWTLAFNDLKIYFYSYRVISTQKYFWLLFITIVSSLPFLPFLTAGTQISKGGRWYMVLEPGFSKLGAIFRHLYINGLVFKRTEHSSVPIDFNRT